MLHRILHWLGFEHDSMKLFHHHWIGIDIPDYKIFRWGSKFGGK